MSSAADGPDEPVAPSTSPTAAEQERARVLIENDSNNFKDLGPQYRRIKCLALLAVSHNGRLLEYASIELQQDPEVVAAAVVNEPQVVFGLTAEMLSSRVVAMALLPTHAWMFRAFPVLRYDVKVLRAVFSLEINRSAFPAYAAEFWERRLHDLYPNDTKQWLLNLLCCATKAAKSRRVDRLPVEMWEHVLWFSRWKELQYIAPFNFDF